jgi:hypothetical protein
MSLSKDMDRLRDRDSICWMVNPEAGKFAGDGGGY